MKKSKGAISGNIPLIFIVILSTGLGLQAYFAADSMASEVSQGMSDLSHVSNTRTTSDVYYHQYLKNSATFSVHQKAYDLARIGAGLPWNSDSVQDLNVTMTQEPLSQLSNNFFQSNYESKQFGGVGCDVENTDFKLYIPNPQKSMKTTSIEDSLTNDIAHLGTNCEFSGSKVHYNSEEGYFSTKYKSRGNRFFQAANDSTEYWKIFDKAIDKASDRKFKNRSAETACTGPVTDEMFKDAEKGAAIKARNKIDHELSSAENEMTLEPGFKIKYGLSPNFGQKLKYNTEIGGWTAAVTYDTVETDVKCNCIDEEEHSHGGGGSDGDGEDDGDTPPDSDDDGIPDRLDPSPNGGTGVFFENPILGAVTKRLPGVSNSETKKADFRCNEWAYKKYAEAEIEPTALRAWSQIKDEPYAIPTSSGWKNLTFVVPNFRHDFGGLSGSSSDDLSDDYIDDDGYGTGIFFNSPILGAVTKRLPGVSNSKTKKVGSHDGPSSDSDEDVNNQGNEMYVGGMQEDISVQFETESGITTSAVERNGQVAESLRGSDAQVSSTLARISGLSYHDAFSITDGGGGGKIISGCEPNCDEIIDDAAPDNGGGDSGVDDSGGTGTEGGTSTGGTSDGGDGLNEPECTYQGRDRKDYNYYGDSQDLFDRFVDCEITVDEFQTQTPGGDGTALTCLPGAGCQSKADLTDEPGFEQIEMDGKAKVSANGPFAAGKVRFECSLRNFEVKRDTQENVAGPVIYINNEPYRVQELVENGYGSENCGEERPEFSELDGLENVAAEATPFWIKRGEIIATGEDSLHFFAREKGFMNNLFFRTGGGSSSEACGIASKGIRPIEELSQSQQTQFCDFSNVLRFTTGNYRLSVCEYDENDEMAKVVLSAGISQSEIKQSCTTPAKKPTVPDQSIETQVQTQVQTQKSQETQDDENEVYGGEGGGLSSVKADSRFEKSIDAPACDASSSNVKIIDEDSDWEDINSGQYNVFCVQPGDYRDAGPQDVVNRIEITASGSEGERKYMLYDGSSSEHPVNQDKKAWINGIKFESGASYWTVQGISVDPRNSRGALDFPIKTEEGAENVIFDRVFAGAPNNGWTETYITMIKGDYTTIQNSVMRNTESGGDAYCINGNAPEVVGVRIVSNELYDCTDSLQLSTVHSDRPSFPGWVIAHNDMYFTERYHADGNGNRDPNGEWRCGENALDFKGGSKDSSRPVRVIGNKMWNYVDADQGCSASGTGPSAYAFVIHESKGNIPNNIEVKNNIIFHNEGGISMNTVGSNVEVENNLFEDFGYLDANGNPAEGVLTYNSDKVTVNGNTMLDGKTWITARTDLSLTENVFVDAGQVVKTTNADTSGNVYYGDSERWGDESSNGNPSVSEANMEEFCVTLRAYTNPREKCFQNAVSTSNSPHDAESGFTLPESFDSSGSGSAVGKPPMNGYWYKGYFFEWSSIHDRVDWPGYTEETVNKLGEPAVLGVDVGNQDWASIEGSTQGSNKIDAVARWANKNNPKEGNVYTKDGRYVYYVSWFFSQDVENQGVGEAYDKAAAGEYNDHYRKFAQRLKDKGLSDQVIIRLQPEFNGNWGDGEGNEEEFKQAWRQYHDTVKSVDSDIMLAYSPALNQDPEVVRKAYPGDEYVDYLGLSGIHDGTAPLYEEENFDECDNSREYPDVSEACADVIWEEAWNHYKTQEFGLDQAAEFANKHELPMAFLEWGLKNKKTGYPAEFMGGDNPRFIRAKYNWMVEHNVHFQTEFEATGKDWHLSSGNVPNSLDAYQDTFKQGSETDYIKAYRENR